VQGAAPKVGAHNEEVLREWGVASAVAAE
jgi:crotonobetainyl-CoA:carnitine CoA-transferase CaiB-like acyl-CoA transferase